MEYIKSSSTNLDKYIDEFHSEVKETFANSLTKIYKAEINVYRDLIETVVKLPFIQEIIHENNMLKSKLKQMTEENDTIKLEIHDKPLIKTDIVDIENIPFTTEVSSEEEDDEESSTDEEEEPSADQDEEEEEPSADQDEEEEEPSADQEEEPSADQEEEPSADQEEEPSADEEEETSADQEEEPSADEEEETSADEEEETSADEEEETFVKPTFPTKQSTLQIPEENEKQPDEEVEEEEPSADQDEEEPSADQEEEEPSADEEEEPSADEEETEVFEIEIDDKTYYCDGEENGNIYEDMNGEVGDIVGEIKDGEANFF